jgi:hypothetical protein
VYDTETISSFQKGTYLQYQVSGTVVIKMISMNGTNVLLSGMFFD